MQQCGRYPSHPTFRSLIGARPETVDTSRSPSSATTLKQTPTAALPVSAWRQATGKPRQDSLRNDSRPLYKPCGLQMCAVRDRCTKNTYRCITRYENEATMDRMADRLAARPEVIDRRRESVEHPFLRFAQAVDGPWRLPDAATRERPCGVQSHRFGLQHAASHQPRRDSGHDFGRNGVKRNFAFF